MKKVLGIVVSHRRLGNSEILVKEIMNSIPDECHCEMIRLTDLKLEPCKACYYCLQNDGCIVEDDFNFVFNRIIQADAVIIGVPIYLLGPQAYYKMFNDRLVSAFKYADQTAGKPCVLVIPFGIKGWEGYARAAALAVPRLLQMKIIDCWQVEATLPAESLLQDSNLLYARSLGRRIFAGPAYQPGERECPFCGSDLFRLHPENKIECPICKVEGVLREGNIPSWPEGDACRFSEANIHEHFDGWVRDMKSKFREDKEQLKSVQKGYREINWWIKP